MYFYLDTTSKDFILSFYDKDLNLRDSVILKEYPKKVHLIVSEFEKMVSKHQIDLTQVSAFLTNLGPGFFTGVRSSLVFLRTIAMTLQKPIYTINAFEILKHQNPNQETFFIDAQGDKVFFYQNKFNKKNVDKNEIDVVDFDHQKIDKINFEEFTENIKKYFDYFNKEKTLLEIEPLYIKQPQIGVKKC